MKKQSRLSSAIWMVLTITGISFGLYKATQSKIESTEQTQAPQTAAACSVGNIAVDKLHARRQGSHTIITGRLVNNCTQAVGAQIKITTYDGAGGILSVDDIWPASVRNIPAHAALPFEWIADGRGLSTFTAQAIGVKAWK